MLYINGFMPSYTHLYPVFLDELLTKFVTTESLDPPFGSLDGKQNMPKTSFFFVWINSRSLDFVGFVQEG